MSALPKTVLAIDPGTAKLGMALVRRESDDRTKALWHAVVAPEHLIPKLHGAYSLEPYVLMIAGSGTAGSHWDEETYDNELMTGYINDANYMSTMSGASFADLGYQLSSNWQQVVADLPLVAA